MEKIYANAYDKVIPAPFLVELQVKASNLASRLVHGNAPIRPFFHPPAGRHASAGPQKLLDLALPTEAERVRNALAIPSGPKRQLLTPP